MKKPIFILTILILIITVLFVTRTVVSNRISTSGVALGRTQEALGQYRTENMILREKIFALSSLSHISEVASKKGFVESKSSFAILHGLPIALRQ